MLETTKFCCKFLAFLAFNTKNAGRNIQQTETLNSRHVTRIMIPDVCIQWGYEYWSFEYRKHLNTVLLVIKNVHLCALSYVLDQPFKYQKRKQDGTSIQMVGLSDIQMALDHRTIWILESLGIHIPSILTFWISEGKDSISLSWARKPSMSLRSYSSLNKLESKWAFIKKARLTTFFQKLCNFLQAQSRTEHWEYNGDRIQKLQKLVLTKITKACQKSRNPSAHFWWKYDQ